MKLFARIACFALAFASFETYAQNLWTPSSLEHRSFFLEKEKNDRIKAYKQLSLDASALYQQLTSVPFFDERSMELAVTIDLPRPDGTIKASSIIETSLWEDKVAMHNAGIRTFNLVDPATKSFEGTATVYEGRLTALIFDGTRSVYIEPIGAETSDHIVYFVSDVEGPVFPCPEISDASPSSSGNAQRGTAGDCQTRTYRLAVAATGEYTQNAGGVPQAVARITSTVNSITAIFFRDLNVKFSLVNNTNIIFTDPTTDPYTQSAAQDDLTMTQCNNTMNSVVGAGNYDIAITFSSLWNGGRAGGIGTACNANKGAAAAGYPTTTGAYFVGVATHELGHTYGGRHSMSGTCSGANDPNGGWEPGAGSTIMGYPAVCTPTYQTNFDMYFHAGNIAQMQTYILNSATCVTGVASGNQSPSISISGTSYNIPANTPFVLSLNATDANGDALTYTWEQVDGNFSTNASPSSTSTTGPLFRSYPPSNTGNTRYFPSLALVSNGTISTTWEVIPTVARTMNFRGTVRDNSALGGCTAEANVTLNVRSSTGFAVTAPAWGTVWTKNGSNTGVVQWNVAGTNASPINCATVDIFLSTNGGLSFPITLATGVPNTGTANVAIPAVNTVAARVMVKGANNVFYNVSLDDFKIADPMPVTFISFTARKEGSKSILNWSTATETNSNKFIVERSSNGTDFKEVIGTVKAAGNSTTVQNYSLADNAPLNKWNYYRLKQIDLDGKFAYSNIASVYFSKDNSSFVSIYPNPVKDQTTIDFYTVRAGKVKMEVYDSKGALVSSQTYNSVTGMNRTTIDVQSLSTGIYTLKCYTSNELIGVTKLIKN